MTEKSRVPALNRCLSILEIISKYDHCSIADMANYAGIPRSSVYVLIDEMQKQRLIRQREDGSYQLWVRLIELGQLAKAGYDLQDLVIGEAKTLMTSIEHTLTVHFGIMDGDKAFYMIKLSNPNSSFIVRSYQGGEISLNRDGIGKCLLAFQDEVKRERLIGDLEYIRVTERSIMTPDSLRHALAEIRLQGWAIGDAENEPEFRSISVPVWGAGNKLMGALSALSTRGRFSDDKLPEIIGKVKMCAENLSRKLGHHE